MEAKIYIFSSSINSYLSWQDIVEVFAVRPKLFVNCRGAPSRGRHADNAEQKRRAATSHKLQCMIMRRICSDILTPGLNRLRNL